MSNLIQKMMKYVWSVPRGTKLERGGRKNPNNYHYYRKWGFTIYRTYYGKEFDEHWQALLYSLRHQTKLAFGTYEDDGEINQDDRQQIRDLFYLEVREDPLLLDGLDVLGLRKFYNTEKENAPEVIEEGFPHRLPGNKTPRERQAMADYLFNFVLLADESILKDIERGEFVVKAVSLLWEGASGWGWMRIPTGYLLDLWTFLMWNDDRTERCLRFHGSEEDLANHIWAGDTALDYTRDCSEVRPWEHYSSQKDIY